MSEPAKTFEVQLESGTVKRTMQQISKMRGANIIRGDTPIREDENSPWQKLDDVFKVEAEPKRVEIDRTDWTGDIPESPQEKSFKLWVWVGIFVVVVVVTTMMGPSKLQDDMIKGAVNGVLVTSTAYVASWLRNRTAKKK